MAAELEIGGLENRIEAAFALTPGWHNLGTVLDYVPDSESMAHAAGLNWTVSMRPLFDGDGHPVDGFSGTYRDDTNKSLGVVSNKYKLVQNWQQFQILDKLTMDRVMRYESAGALRGGRIVFVLARMPETDQIADGDNTYRYILFSTSHDGSACLHATPTIVRVVCANTLRAALRGQRGYRHIGDMDGKLRDISLYLSQFNSAFTLFRDNARRLATSRLDPIKAKAYIETLFPPVAEDGRGKSLRDNKVNAIRANFVNERNAMPSIKGTWWSLFNSVTEYVDHQASFKGQGRERAENRMLSVIDGDGADLKSKAWEAAIAMSGIAPATMITV